MKRASTFFTESERSSIAEAVSAAEKKTSGEIVPVVATASGRYDRAEDLVGLCFSILLLIAGWILFQEVRPMEGDWASGQRLVLGLVPIVVIVLVGFGLGAALSTWIPALKLPFLSRSEIEMEVDRGAADAFQRFRVRGTAAGTGVLIYISLFEHTVQVIGDDAIASKVTQDDWNQVRDLVLDGIRAGQAAEGFSQAIALCGDLLAAHFPIEPGDVDELTNELRIID
ncbi:TPM domain-containing protein [Gemmatimonadota bacterium]